MKEEESLYILKKRAVPEVLLKVVEAKRLLDSEKVYTVQDATEAVGISRSSFYKYKDDIDPFYEHARGKTITCLLQMDDQPGVLAFVLEKIASFGANILTIHQSIPVNGIASITISMEIVSGGADISRMLDEVEQVSGIQYIKVLARE